VQGTPLAALSLEDYALPSAAYTRTNFITAKAVARHLVEGRAGVILTLSTPGSRLPGTGFLRYGVTCSAIEALSRLLAAELGASGIRVVCLRPDAIRAALAAGSHTREVFRGPAQRSGRTIEAMLAERTHGDTGAPAAARRGRRRGGLAGLGPGGRDDRYGRQPDLRLAPQLTRSPVHKGNAMRILTMHVASLPRLCLSARTRRRSR
jgi:NAD(P)-dependent dehydrogenase (short-subunit alcohol dehydrogenase family)